MAHDIFISYSSKDKQTADAICHVLETNKLRCWIAPRNIHAGKNYPEQIMNGIRNAKIVVLVFSKNSQESVFVNNEIDTAFSNNKPIISFKIDETLPEKRMEFFLRNKHWLDAYPDPDKVFERLVNDAYLLCEEEPEQEYIETDFQEEHTVEVESSASLEEKLQDNEGVVDFIEMDEYPTSSNDETKDLEKTSTSLVDDNNFESDDSEIPSSESSFSKFKVPIIAICIIIVIAVLGIVLSGSMQDSNNSNSGIVINYVELDDDRDKDYSWDYSYFVIGNITSKTDNSSDSVIHIDYLDSSGKVINSNTTKLKDFDGSILGSLYSDKNNVAKVSVELKDGSGKTIGQAESENIIS